jgi:type I restriction enzyme S subunit
MNKNSDNKLVPKLRFPDFTTKESWNLMQIGDILDAQSSSLALNKLELNKNGYAVYGADSIVGYIDTYQHSEQYISIVKDGSGVGRLNLCKSETSTLGTLAALKSKDKDKYLIVWAYYLLKTIDFSSYVKGAGIPHIYYSDYKRHTIGVAKPKEQQKIADCLSSLDEVITAESKKLEVLKEHKKGLLQNLFPQAGETVPKLRFKEFEKSGDWKYFNGNILFEPIANKNHNSDLPILAITQDRGAIPRDMIDYTVIATDKSIESYKVVEDGDFIISLRSFQGGIEFSNYKGICSPAYIILRNKVDLVKIFFKYYFKTDIYIFQLNKNIEGIRDGKMVSYKQFSDIQLPLPTLPEQQKIASCLSSIDELIIAQSQKLEALQLHKKGLLQSMFPTVNN